ncbi:MAG TPA: ABC transporter permease [Candidatus Limnocylindrales bacterium]|nr:ABC transporter permease [Candidatus Limnocylindrales bacterium]
MNPRRVAAVARRIAEGFRRDRRSLALLVVAPLVIVALLGWVLRDQKQASVDIVAVNQAGIAGDRLVSALQTAAVNAGNGTTVDTADSRDAAVQRLKDGTADLALVIPSTLLTDVASGKAPVLTIITEGTDPAAEGGAFGSLQGLLPAVARSIVPPGASAPVVPTVQRETVYLSPGADQLDVLAPVFLGLFAYFFVFILTGVSFLRERVGGTLERLLATPVTRGEIVLGYSLGFSFFATIQVLIMTVYILGRLDVPAFGPVGAFTLGLDAPSAGSPLIAFFVGFLLAVGAVNLAIFLSTFARTELQIVQFIPIVIVPQGLLGGIFWPIDRLPDVLQWIAHVLPVTYAVEALREVMLKGADLGSSVVETDLLVLAGIAVVFVILASLTIKREVA